MQWTTPKNTFLIECEDRFGILPGTGSPSLARRRKYFWILLATYGEKVLNVIKDGKLFKQTGGLSPPAENRREKIDLPDDRLGGLKVYEPWYKLDTPHIF